MEQVLEEIGFEKNESKAYLFLLKNPESSQQDISDKTGILRQTVYDLIKKMELKGYVASSVVGKRKVYSSVEPKIILNQLKEKEEKFLQVLPSLEKLKKPSISLSAQTFIGMKGLKNLFNLILESKDEILWMINKELSDKIFQGYYWHNYATKRIDLKIPIKLLIEETSDKDWDSSSKVFRSTRNIKFVNGLDSSFVVFGDSIIIFSMVADELYGVYISNKSLASFFRKIFFSYW